MRSIRAAKKVTVHRFATAAVVAAFLSTPAAAQGTGGTMPANCEQNLNQCSLKIWTHNSFPRAGYQQSTTFSNGMTLTCTSNGADKVRTCTLKESHAANGSGDGDQEAVSPGTDKNVVRRAQFRLGELGYYTGPADGRLGSSTTDALKRYQNKKLFPDTGVLDFATLRSLGVSPTLARDEVLRVQSRLREEGVYAGPIDGALTSTTEDAIRRYQLKVGLPVTGDLDEGTLMKLGLVH